jgi:AraC-like DNA-binding protein
MKNKTDSRTKPHAPVKYAHPERWNKLNTDFRINAFGIMEGMPPFLVDRPVGTGDFLFMLFHDPVLVRINGISTKVSPGTIVMWPNGAAHWYGNESLEWSHSWIHFAGDWAVERVKECGFDQKMTLTLQNPEVMTDWLWNLYAEQAGQQQPDSIILKNIFHNGLRMLLRNANEIPDLFIPARINQVKHFLNQHLNSQITLSQLARDAGISIPHLSAEFKRYCGDSPINYLIKRRLQQARYLLLDRNLSISEIADRVGYEDLFHFSRLFKKHFGISPRDMRKRLLQPNTLLPDN